MIKIVIQLVLFITTTFVIITHLLLLIFLQCEKHTKVYSIENLQYNSKQNNPDSKIFNFNLLFIIKVIVIEIFCILLHIILLPFSNLQLNIKSEEGKNKYPILLIPGFLENQTDWWLQRFWLHHVGITKIYLLNLHPALALIEEHAQIVYNEVIRIKKETHASHVILIGHSRGGLVASYCYEHLAKDDIAMIITLGTPFQGSLLATYFVHKNMKALQQMQPNSDFLTNLSQKTQNSILPYYCTATTLDSLVYPVTSSFPILSNHKLLKTHILQDIGHIGLLKSIKVKEQLKLWLT